MLLNMEINAISVYIFVMFREVIVTHTGVSRTVISVLPVRVGSMVSIALPGALTSMTNGCVTGTVESVGCKWNYCNSKCNSNCDSKTCDKDTRNC